MISDEDITEVDAPMPKSDSKEEREKNEKGPKGKKEGTVMEDANVEVDNLCWLEMNLSGSQLCHRLIDLYLCNTMYVI